MPPVMWFIRRGMRRSRTRGMSVPQYRTLCMLDAQPTASLSAVAENLGASLPTTSRIVAGLVTKGLAVRKTSAEDRRQCQLRLTPTGRAALTAGRRATEDQLAAEVASMTNEQRVIVVEAMKLLGDVFGRTDAAADPDAEAG